MAFYPNAANSEIPIILRHLDVRIYCLATQHVLKRIIANKNYNIPTSKTAEVTFLLEKTSQTLENSKTIIRNWVSWNQTWRFNIYQSEQKLFPKKLITRFVRKELCKQFWKHLRLVRSMADQELRAMQKLLKYLRDFRRKNAQTLKLSDHVDLVQKMNLIATAIDEVLMWRFQLLDEMAMKQTLWEKKKDKSELSIYNLFLYTDMCDEKEYFLV